jgi:hypothetical protein
MMRKQDVDEFARKRPFEPFELKLVDGQRHRFQHPEEFLVARDHIITLDRRARTVFIRIGLITTIGPVTRGGMRRPRKPRAR